MQTVYLKSVQSILDTYAPVYPAGASWDATLAYMLDTPVEEEIISLLKLQYEETGSFREPICLVGEGTEESPHMVGNGTHRLITAYLLDVEEVLVQDGYMSDNPALEHKTFVTELIGVPDEAISDELSDELFNVLRSVPVSSTVWMTASIASGRYPDLSLYWDEFPEGQEEAITAAVAEKLRRYFPALALTVRTFVETWEDEEDPEDEALWASIGD